MWVGLLYVFALNSGPAEKHESMSGTDIFGQHSAAVDIGRRYFRVNRNNNEGAAPGTKVVNRERPCSRLASESNSGQTNSSLPAVSAGRCYFFSITTSVIVKHLAPAHEDKGLREVFAVGNIPAGDTPTDTPMRLGSDPTVNVARRFAFIYIRDLFAFSTIPRDGTWRNLEHTCSAVVLRWLPSGFIRNMRPEHPPRSSLENVGSLMCKN